MPTACVCFCYIHRLSRQRRKKCKTPCCTTATSSATCSSSPTGAKKKSASMPATWTAATLPAATTSIAATTATTAAQQETSSARALLDRPRGGSAVERQWESQRPRMRRRCRIRTPSWRRSDPRLSGGKQPRRGGLATRCSPTSTRRSRRKRRR